MTDEPSQLYLPRRKVVLAMLVFSALALLLNTSTFVNWAYEAPFPAEITEWLIRRADSIDRFGREAGFNALYDWVQNAVSELRDQ